MQLEAGGTSRRFKTIAVIKKLSCLLLWRTQGLAFLLTHSLGSSLRLCKPTAQTEGFCNQKYDIAAVLTRNLFSHRSIASSPPREKRVEIIVVMSEEEAKVMAVEEPKVMAVEEANKGLDYIPEVILKKRKNRDELAFIRKKQLELGNFGKKKKKVADIKRPEDFVLEFRAKEIDLIRMKQRVKRPRASPPPVKSNLVFIIRIQGKNDMHPKTKKVLNSMQLRSTFTGVFAKATDGLFQKLLKVQPYVTYGYPNGKSVKDLIFKKGYTIIEGNPVPLTDNNIIEQALGEHGIFCIEDIVNEIARVGDHFREVMRFLGPLKLNKPEAGVLHGKKQVFSDGGDTGNREDKINDLIIKMN